MTHIARRHGFIGTMKRLKRQVKGYRESTRSDANEIQRQRRMIEVQDQTIEAMSLRLTELEAIHSALVSSEVVPVEADPIDVGNGLAIPSE